MGTSKLIERKMDRALMRANALGARWWIHPSRFNGRGDMWTQQTEYAVQLLIRAIALRNKTREAQCPVTNSGDSTAQQASATLRPC